MRDPFEEFRRRRPTPGPGSRPAYIAREGHELGDDADEELEGFFAPAESAGSEPRYPLRALEAEADHEHEDEPDTFPAEEAVAPEEVFAAEEPVAPTPPPAPEPPPQAVNEAPPSPPVAAPAAASAPAPPASDAVEDEEDEAAPAAEDVSTPAMLRLMRIELESAQRHRFPFSCLVIGLDGFAGPENDEARRTLMPAIFRELKVVCVKNDVRGLGTWSPTFQLAVFPHVAPDQATEIAKALMERVRRIRLRIGDLVEKATISVGVAHNQRRGEVAFEDLLDDAEAGLRLANSYGGDRCIQFRQVEGDIGDLKDELIERAAELRARQRSYFADKAKVEDKWGRELLEKLLAVFQAEQDVSEATMRLEQRVMETVGREVDALRENSNLRALAESQHQIEQLERRIHKLTESLERTEAELVRVAAMKEGDVGIASIYRTVQGLSGNDANSEAKREMMRDIFNANLALKSQMKGAKKSA